MFSGNVDNIRVQRVFSALRPSVAGRQKTRSKADRGRLPEAIQGSANPARCKNHATRLSFFLRFVDRRMQVKVDLFNPRYSAALL